VERAGPTVAQHAADVSGALAPHTAELSSDIYELIVREIPQLRADSRVLTLLEASVAENVATVLHILQHGIDLDRVHAPAAAEEYARRLAQRGSPMAALLRAYRIGSTRFQHWCLRELGRHTDDAAMISAAGLRIAETTAAYIDRVSEELVAAYEAEKENWLRNLGAARAARVRALLQGDRIDVDASEAVLGYRLRQYHVGVVCWVGDGEAGGPALERLERATMAVAPGGVRGAAVLPSPGRVRRLGVAAAGCQRLLRRSGRPQRRCRGRARNPVRLRRGRRWCLGLPSHPPTGVGRARGRAGRWSVGTARDQLHRGGAAGPDVVLGRAAADLGARDARAAGR
jgi:hypothetical protein